VGGPIGGVIAGLFIIGTIIVVLIVLLTLKRRQRKGMENRDKRAIGNAVYGKGDYSIIALGMRPINLRQALYPPGSS